MPLRTGKYGENFAEKRKRNLTQRNVLGYALRLVERCCWKVKEKKQPATNLNVDCKLMSNAPKFWYLLNNKFVTPAMYVNQF